MNYCACSLGLTFCYFDIASSSSNPLPPPEMLYTRSTVLRATTDFHNYTIDNATEVQFRPELRIFHLLYKRAREDTIANFLPSKSAATEKPDTEVRKNVFDQGQCL
jgi:hypothetical protein